MSTEKLNKPVLSLTTWCLSRFFYRNWQWKQP